MEIERINAMRYLHWHKYSDVQMWLQAMSALVMNTHTNEKKMGKTKHMFDRKDYSRFFSFSF